MCCGTVRLGDGVHVLLGCIYHHAYLYDCSTYREHVHRVIASLIQPLSNLKSSISMLRIFALFVVSVILHIAFSAAMGPKKLDLAADMDNWKDRVKKAMAKQVPAEETGEEDEESERDDSQDGPDCGCLFLFEIGIRGHRESCRNIWRGTGTHRER